MDSDRTSAWRWLLQATPQAQARSLRVCHWLSLRREWSLRKEWDLVDRPQTRRMGPLLRTSEQVRERLLPGAARRRDQVEVVKKRQHWRLYQLGLSEISEQADILWISGKCSLRHYTHALFGPSSNRRVARWTRKPGRAMPDESSDLASASAGVKSVLP